MYLNKMNVKSLLHNLEAHFQT